MASAGAELAGELLAPGEPIVLETRQHRYVIVRETVLAVVGLAALLLSGSTILARFGTSDRDALVVIGAIVICLVAGLVVGRAVWRIICWRYTWYVVTDRRVIVTSGVATRRTASAWLHRVTEARLEVPYLARVLHRLGYQEYGHITIRTSVEPGLLGTLSWIPDPTAAAILIDPRVER